MSSWRVKAQQLCLILYAFSMFLCAGCLAADKSSELQTDLYINPHPVEITGYSGSPMEPFISLEGKFLFFNSDEDPHTHAKTMHFASRTGLNSFRYLGEVQGVNIHKEDTMEAVAPSMDNQGHFYFTSTRQYDKDSQSVFVGDFDGTTVKNIHAVTGDITPQDKPGLINMDVSISPDGNTLYISRTHFNPIMALLFHASPDESTLLIAHRQSDAFFVDAKSADILKKINTPELNYAPDISADGLELYFTRADTTTGLRIMVAKRTTIDAPFQEACALKTLTGFVEAPSLSLDKQEMFFHKKVDDKFIIFRAERNPSVTGSNFGCH